MVHGSLHLATIPQRFPAGRLGSCASRAARCGFVMVDTVRGRGAVTPGKCRRCSVRDWLPTRRRSAPTLPQKGPCGCAASPAPAFSAPAPGTRSGDLLPDRECSPRRKSFSSHTVLLKRRGEGRKGGMREKESNRQRSGKRPVATALLVGRGGWGQARGPPRAVLDASGLTKLLLAGGVAVEFSPDHRRSA